MLAVCNRSTTLVVVLVAGGITEHMRLTKPTLIRARHEPLSASSGGRPSGELNGAIGALSCYDSVVDDPMASERRLRTVGKRRHPPRATAAEVGQPPPVASRTAMTRMAQYRTRVPKGIFIYSTHEEANHDWDEWRVAGMVANTRARR